MEGLMYIPNPTKWEMNFCPQLVAIADAYGIDDTKPENLPHITWLLLAAAKLN